MDRTSAAIRIVLQAVRARATPAEVVALVLRQACGLATAVRGSLIRVDHDEGSLDITSTFGSGWNPEKLACRLRIGEGITGWVARTGQPCLVRDTSRDPRYVGLFDEVKSELAVPVLVRDQVWAVINLDGFEVDVFTEEDLTTLSLFAELVSFALTLQEEFIERQLMQEELMEGQKMAATSKVIAGIAHELNNPLTTVLGQASLLALASNLTTQNMSSLRSIMREAQRASRIIRTLLHFSRRETSERKVVALRDIAAKVLELREYPLRVQNIRLEFRDSDPPAAVEANLEQTVQILLNLVNNAEQAVVPTLAKGGGARSHGSISIRAERSGEGIRLRVQDSGCGIPEDTAKSIFQPFFSTRGVGEGTGLGLAVGRTLMESHGGKLFLESSDSSGSCFVLEFPQVLPLPAPADAEAALGADLPVEVAAPPAPAAPARKQGRILVVDDEPAILEFLHRFLNILQIDVVTAANGLEGLEKLKQGSYHVVLSDIKMPELDGVGFYEEAVARHPDYQRRFVFMSGDLQGQNIQEFHKKTGCRFLEKPFTTAQLRDALFSYFEAPAPAAPALA